MDSTKEYKALKIFEGKGFRGNSTRLPPSYYLAELDKFLLEDEISELISKFELNEWIEITDDNKQIMLLSKGKDYYDNTYYREQAYDIVNYVLKKLEKRTDGIDTSHQRYPRITEIINNLLEQNTLIEYLSYPKRLSLAKLTEEGYKALDFGGILPYLKMKEKWEQEEMIQAGILAKNNGQSLFGEGSYFDAYTFIRGLVTNAKKSITLIDNHVDDRTLTILSDLSKNLKLCLITIERYIQQKTFQRAVELFRNQYGDLQLATSKVFHDRFLVIDDTDFYVIGASVMDAGNKLFMIVKIEDLNYHNAIRKRILNSNSIQ